MADEIQPYVGPRPFERGDESRFFGREGEAGELLSYVIAHPAVLLYSQSGAGKTSLLNARLIPFLEDEGFEILPLARVRGLVPQNMRQDEIPNLYVFNVLMSWAEGLKEDAPSERTTLKEFLQNRFHPAGKENTHTPFVAIFDQFEELFTFYPERWGDRQEFFDQVADALEVDGLMRVVFVMREDFIAELDPYVSVLPEKLRTRFRLERLRAEDALNAAKEPLHGTGYSFAEGVAEQLVQNLLNVPVEIASGITTVTGEFVEPVQLQVVCQTLWEKLHLTNERVITQTALETFGNVDKALSGFYETAIANTSKRAGVTEGLLRRLFEETLITPSGTRGTVFGGGQDVGGVPSIAIRHLVNEHLLRAERRGGSIWYELTHDRLIEPIRTSNQRWRLARTGTEQTQHRLEARSAEWVRNGRADDYLLDEAELLEAKRWLESPAAEEVGYSEALFALVQASRAAIEEAARGRDKLLFEEQQRRAEAEREAEEQRRRLEVQAGATKRLRRLAAALAVMFLLAVGTAVYAVNQTRLARQKEQEAKDNLLLAQRQEARANDQAKITEEQRQRAEKERGEAEKQKAFAEASAVKADLAKNEAEKQAQLAALREREANAKAIEIARLKESEIARIQSEKDREQAQTFLSFASTFDQIGNFDKALKNYEALLPLYRKIDDPKGKAFTLHRIGTIHSKKSHYEAAENAYKEALEVRKSLPKQQANDLAREQDRETALILNDLAMLYEDQDKYELAEPVYRQALKIEEDLNLGDSSLNEIYWKLARIYMRRENYSQAEAFYQQVLLKDKGRTNDESITNVLNDLGQINRQRGNYQEAAQYYQRALSINEASYAQAENIKPVAVAVVAVRKKLLEIYTYLNNYVEIEQQLEKIYKTLVKAFGSNHPKVFSSLSEYGLFYDQQGRDKEAEEKYRKAFEQIDERIVELDADSVVKMLKNYAALLRRMKREDEAARLEVLAQTIGRTKK